MNISRQSFGNLRSGERVFLIKMKNGHGIEVEILTYGAVIKSIKTPDLNGQFDDIVLGKDKLHGYLEDNSYLGAIVGPVAGRIANAKAMIGGQVYQFEANEKNNTLHSGSTGLHQKNWESETFTQENSVKVILSCKAKDFEGGYPGNRIFKVTYTLNNKNQLLINFDAKTDKDTLINMTTHSYFNLSGKHQNIYDHWLMINALKILNTNDFLIPIGNENSVLGGPLNFFRGAKIGDALKYGDSGIDHTYVINKEYGVYGISVKAVHESSGRTITMVTDQPVVMVYTANHFDGTLYGKNSFPLKKHHAFCLEPQHHPDAPNHTEFPSIEIKAGEKYRSRTQITFGLTTDDYHV
jgi:aldose 1-epimerase